MTDIHGNNGHIDGSGAARVTMSVAWVREKDRLTLNGIGKNAVNLLDNFDGTKKTVKCYQHRFHKHLLMVLKVLRLVWQVTSYHITH